MRDSLEMPPWLPPLIAERARAAFAAMIEAGTAEEDVAVVKRLTTDPRMEHVWKYLQRRRREDHYRTADYENPVRDLAPKGPFPLPFPSPFPTRAAYMQNVAMGTFYFNVLCLMTGGRFNQFGGPYPTSPPFLSQFRSSYRDRAEALRAEAKSISEISRKVYDLPRELDRLERSLLQAADAYEKLANASRADSRRQMPAAVTKYIAEELQTLFGHRMYGQTAVVASVILDRDVTTAEAREWCRHEGWVKTHEKQP
jgi:hypothetical protein